MFHLIQKQSTSCGGNRNFLSAEYSSFDQAEKAASDQLQNVNIHEILIVEAKAKVQRTLNIEVSRL